jgi:transcriptional regulator with XRE-family HTH domain
MADMADSTSDVIVNILSASPRALRKRIGRRAQDARLAARRSQADVARAAGVSLPTVQRFEAGANVSVDALIRIAVALNAERELRDLFPLPDARTIEQVLERRRLPQRGRTR